MFKIATEQLPPKTLIHASVPENAQFESTLNLHRSHCVLYLLRKVKRNTLHPFGSAGEIFIVLFCLDRPEDPRTQHTAQCLLPQLYPAYPLYSLRMTKTPFRPTNSSYFHTLSESLHIGFLEAHSGIALTSTTANVHYCVVRLSAFYTFI